MVESTTRARGRPATADADRAVPIRITLSPAALALIDANVPQRGRSAEIERMIMERWS